MNNSNGTKIIIAIAAAAAAFLCLCLVIGVAILIATQTIAPSLPKVKEPVVLETEIVVTEAPLPTITTMPAVPPTEVPMEEPEPTETMELEEEPTEAPAADDNSGSYDDQMIEKLTACQSGIEIVSEQMVTLKADKALLSDSEWQGSTILGLAFMQASCTTFSEIEPVPAGYEEAHEQLLLAEEKFESAIADMTEGIDQNDITKIQSGAESIVEAGDYLFTAADLLP